MKTTLYFRRKSFLVYGKEYKLIVEGINLRDATLKHDNQIEFSFAKYITQGNT